MGDDMSAGVELPSFGAYLRHLRGRRKMSRTKLAAEADVSSGYVDKLEQGRMENPSHEVVEKFAAVLTKVDAERQHLRDLSVYRRRGDLPVPAKPEIEITDQMRYVVDNLVPHLAGYVDSGWNVLYANSEYLRLYRELGQHGNVLAWFFRASESKQIMVEWELEASLTVGWFRA